jgi:hypothetical protein
MKTDDDIMLTTLALIGMNTKSDNSLKTDIVIGAQMMSVQYITSI